MVLADHLLLSTTRFSDASVDGDTMAIGSWSWLFAHTPAHIVWAGEEAVLVFFVLSGLVLAMPATRRPMRWRSYYPQRLLRLYLPVWGAVVFSVAMLYVAPRAASLGRSTWLNVQADVSPWEAVTDGLLLNGVGNLNTPLWSLQWEVAFSLLLPLYFFLARSSARVAILRVAVILALVAVGTLIASPAVRLLPIFGLGVLIAFQREPLDAAAQWIEARDRSQARLIWTVLSVLTVILLTARWTLGGLPGESPLLKAAGSGAMVFGACLTVMLAMYCPAARAALERPSVQWVGKRSFSLYLIHEPIIVSLAFLLPTTFSPWRRGAITLAVVLAATILFYRLVEMPAHRLARTAGRRAGRPAVPAAKAAVPANEPAVPAAIATVPANERAVPANEPAVPANEPAVPANEPAVPAAIAAVTANEPAVPEDETDTAASMLGK
jgi:peptidoglycan/LPS O-acetylase OafA/YrhL